MAQVYQEVVVIKLSKLIKDNETSPTLATEDLVSSLEQVAQELVGAGIIVESEKA